MSKFLYSDNFCIAPGFPTRRVFVYECEMCGKKTNRERNMGAARILCFDCRREYAKMQRLKK